ncbi:LOW QUALITY PROTEIN: opsin-5-like [Trachemys scripta elegans]|uniref:LOW QUALITY PROTEIN: opsin-5-like n=2 Tax=Emydidae TaxID=8476 RepID=UPI001557B587|nr:LOW QUALITY PROTEIN: opsin-5-like [Trachemys scripta elegans]XP_053873111.1 opsin-5-like isoform X1 [Malaclemys terrapin pileata]XP_053873112.1 opsin-5-like isoform X1 [Malaclemys terrapin pileata]XP_053873113.1 opsin-5-like isoform X1 [Malaclemys terrapin pileata]XP_053873114.1 opsin-5-like isoform X1 [Malaclemys terrapin pileata]
MGSYLVNATFQSKITEGEDIIVGMIYTVFGICSLCGNSILLYVSYKKKNLLKPAEYFMINLAISDLGMTLTLYPLAVTSSLSHRWLYGKQVCLFYAFCGVLFGICSLSTLTLLSTVCCLKICFPAYGNRFRQEHGRILIACAWAYAAIFACSPLAHWGEYGAEPYGTACCIDWHSSNVNTVAMSYTVALFVFCFIIPCGVIVTSYTLILITVKESRKAVEQHVSGPTRMSNVQAITVKMSIAVCIGFFTAWSPYAIIAMWAAFGSIEGIPPLAFAVPAVFAKSSTLYNPVTYLLLKPNFRSTLAKDFGVLQQLCIRTCFCLKALQSCSYRSVLEIGLKSFKGRNESSCNSVQTVEGCSYFPCEKCSDTFECFKNYPKCCQERLSTMEYTPQESVSLESSLQAKRKQDAKKSVKVVVQGEKNTQNDNFEITLETIPAHSRFANL